MKNSLIVLLTLAVMSSASNAQSLVSGKREVKLQPCPKMTDIGVIGSVYTEEGYDKGFAETSLKGCFKVDGNVLLEYQTVFPPSLKSSNAKTKEMFHGHEVIVVHSLSELNAIPAPKKDDTAKVSNQGSKDIYYVYDGKLWTMIEL